MSEIEPSDSPVTGSMLLAATRPTPCNPRLMNVVPFKVTPEAGQVPVLGTRTSRLAEVYCALARPGTAATSARVRVEAARRRLAEACRDVRIVWALCGTSGAGFGAAAPRRDSGSRRKCADRLLHPRYA